MWLVFSSSEWFANYKAKRPGVEVLQRQIDQWMADYDARELQVGFRTFRLGVIMSFYLICEGIIINLVAEFSFNCGRHVMNTEVCKNFGSGWPSEVFCGRGTRCLWDILEFFEE